MSRQIRKGKRSKVQSNNDTSQVSIPKGWAEVLKLMPGDDVERAIFEGKHGKFIAIWNPKQQNGPEDSEEE